MKPDDRRHWIIEYLQPRPRATVDILHASFVEDYIEHCNAPCSPQPYGAAKCPQLGRDLGYLYSVGMLDRSSCGLGDMATMMGCRWVWVYTLAHG